MDSMAMSTQRSSPSPPQSLSSSSSLSSLSSSTSLYSTPQWKHDVFLNFYGKDTRKNFTDHLYTALKQKGIDVFRDDEKLKRGTFIDLELMKAIRESKYAIVILSENYAFSRWCLDELAKILQCMKQTGLTVLPVFYYVNPSAVQNRTETFAEAFAKHEDDPKVSREKLQIWKTALREVGNILGWHLHDRPEATVIRKITRRIVSELYGDFSSLSKELVGMESRLEEMMAFLGTGLKLDDVRFIGIWGMGGVGKTALAEVIYCKISNQFEAKSFISVGSIRETGNHGLVSLQKQLLYEILKEREVNIWDVRGGIDVIGKRLHNRKVLIVLDDVDEKDQLDALARRHSWFGPGSRIIITSRDKHLLERYHMDMIYRVKGLEDDKALELFSWTVFKKPRPEKDFVDLSKGFVKYAQGLPLAFEVLSFSLIDKTRKVWEATLDQLKENPNRRILDTLEIDYKGLEYSTKKLFLDIACFFKGEDKNRVADILKDFGYYKDIEILKDKSLITISGGKLWMHDLLQEMGKEIVSREAPQEPGRRSRLWNDMDIFSVLKNNTGTEFVEGMVINSPLYKEELNAEAFSKMKRLRLIKICNVQLPEGLNYLSNELRMMNWFDYPLKSMPISFRPTNLVELIMPRNCIEQLPTGFANLDKLKLMDLSDSQHLINTPDFNGFPNLERLIFQGCTRLYKIHPSIGALKRLTLLNLKDCKCLHSLPHEINMESLEIFILSGCSRLRNFSKIGSDMTRLLELYLDGTAIEELPSSFKHLTGLILLNLQECKNISSFPQVICSLTSLKILNLLGCNSQPPKSWNFPGLSFIYATLVLWKNSFLIAQHPELEPINLFMPRSFSGLRSLVSLDLSDCNLLDGAFPGDLGCLSFVQFLNLSKSNFTRLPDSISQLPKLRVLYVDNCSRLQALPKLPLSAQFVMARGCASLQNYNEVVVWTPSETGYTFINCLSLVKDKECKIMEVSLQDIHFQPLWKIYMEEQIHQSEGFYSVLPQTEIPGWFNCQSLGSSIPILLPCPLYDNNSWSGIALCAIFAVQNASDVFLGQEPKYFHEFMFHLDTNRDCVDFPLVFNIPKDKFCVGSFGLWLYISRAWFKDHLDECSCISTSLKTNSLSVEIKSTNPNVEVEMCGIHPVYKQDVKELAQTLVRCMLECSNAFYYRYLLHQVNKLPSCNHEKYFGCYFTFQRRPQFMMELPSRTENVEEEGVPVRNGQRESTLSSRLDSWTRTYLKNHYNSRRAFNHCFPGCQIPQWFCHQSDGPSVMIRLPVNLYNNPDWMGFALCVVLSFHDHPSDIRLKLESNISHNFSIFLKTIFGVVGPLLPSSITEDNKLISLYGHSFIWVSFIPCGLLSHQWSQCISVEFLFRHSPDLSVLKCGVNLVYQHSIKEFTHIIAQCITSYGDYLHFINYNEIGGTNNSHDHVHHQRLPISQGELSEDPHPPNQFHRSGPLDFHPATLYNSCFPPNKIQEWFTDHGRGHSVTIGLPTNLFHDSNWLGFALYASFSMHGDATAFLNNLFSKFSHRLHCRFQTHVAGLNDQIVVCLTTEEEIIWLLSLGEFVWVSYIPGKPFKDMLHHQCRYIKASFGSDWPGVRVQKCALRFLYQHDQVQFEQELRHSISTS